MFNKNWIKNLPNNPILAVKELAEKLIQWDKSKTNEERLTFYQSYIEFLAFFEHYSDVHHLKLYFPTLSEDRIKNINRIIEFCYRLAETIQNNITKVMYESAKVRHFGQEQKIDLSPLLEGDRAKVQRIINNLRKTIVESSFEEDFKGRILKRLEKLQAELHKGVTLMERVSEFF